MKRGLLLLTLPFTALLIALTLSAGVSTAESAQITPLPPVENPDGRAGTCFSYYPGDPDRPYLPLVHNVGSRWDRFDFIWPNLEQTNNGWQFDGYDDLVQDMSDAGMNVVGILLWTPDWAATGTRYAQPLSRPVEWPSDWYAPSLLSPQAPSVLSPSPPQGLYEEWNDWKTSDGDPINYWGRYVHKVVSRYSDATRFDKPVKNWEVWNEVDDGAWNYFWTGSEADYAQLLKVGYQATKDACPDCTVLYAGLLYWADQQYFERVLNILNDDPGAPASNYYFDVMSVHLYSRSSTIYDTVQLIRSRMNAHVSDHPIWLTETGVMVWDDGSVDPDPTKYDFAATQEEAAAYVVQSYANAWASGIEQYFFFRANDEDLTEYFGLMRNDQSFRPSYVAYQVAATYLVTPTMVTNPPYSIGVRRVTLWGTPHGKVSVLWNTTPDTLDFDYEATLPTATLVNQRGATQSISATDGEYKISLLGATANLVSNPNDYIIGGEPYLIIEEDTVPPTQATVHPLPTTTYSHTIQVSWEATDAEAGIWGFDVQVSRDGGGWTDWLGLADTISKRSAPYTDGEDGESYCFRARAWDRAGNLGDWSQVERCTTLRLAREVEVHISVGSVFGDQNGSGDPDEGEPIFANAAFRLLASSGEDVVTPALGSSWAFTVTLDAGDYELLVTPPGWPSPPPGWLPRRLPVPLENGGGGGTDPIEVDFPAVGLLPHRSSSFLPLLARNN